MTNLTSSKPTNLFTVAALLFGIYAFYCFWMIVDEKTPLWGILYGIGLSAYIVCLWGIGRRKAWAVPLSYALMLGAFGFGCYLVHFVWTFWIFQKPTLTENILNTLHPRISAFIIFPVVWIVYFMRRRSKLN